VGRPAPRVKRPCARAPVADVRRPDAGRASGGARITDSRFERIPDADRVARKVESGQQKRGSRNEDEYGPENSDPLLPVHASFPLRGAQRSLPTVRFGLTMRPGCSTARRQTSHVLSCLSESPDDWTDARGSGW
jgi:hypothetical protein